MGLSDGEVLGYVLVNVDGITFDIYVVTELGYWDGFFDGYNGGNIEGLLLAGSLRYTDG